MASLQARHSKSCALGSRVWTRAEPDAREGCTCSPTFYLVASLKAGGRNPVGKSYSNAKKALTQAQAAQDRGELLVTDNRTFSEWADEWFASLEGPKATTLDTYAPGLEYAKTAFGTTKLRKLTVEDVREFLGLMTKLSGSTRRKHLGTLSRCLGQAVREGKLASNPVDRLGQSQRPKMAEHEAPYFTDEELPRLIAALEGVDRLLVRLALLTGMRIGELFALRWSHVDLSGRVIHVRQTITDRRGPQSTKSKRGMRDVELTSAAVDVLGELLKLRGVEDDGALLFPPVFPIEYERGYRIVSRVGPYLLFPAMERAGIPRSGTHLTPPTDQPRTFHSLRHTYARIALENGVELTWLSRQMGHSSSAFTEERYGHWSKEARRREVAKLEGASAFGIV